MPNLSFNLEDASQVIIGAFALAVPVSFSEEAWRMGQTLPLANLLLLMSISLLFLALYTYQGVFQGNVESRKFVYIARILIAYVITIFVVMLILLAINKFPIIDQPLVAMKRLIVVSMPASMGAIIVDSFDKE